MSPEGEPTLCLVFGEGRLSPWGRPHKVTRRLRLVALRGAVVRRLRHADPLVEGVRPPLLGVLPLLVGVPETVDMEVEVTQVGCVGRDPRRRMYVPLPQSRAHSPPRPCLRPPEL